MMDKEQIIQHLSNAIEEMRKTCCHVTGDNRELVYHAGRTLATVINNLNPNGFPPDIGDDSE